MTVKVLVLASMLSGLLAYKMHAGPGWILAAAFAAPVACLAALRATKTVIAASRASTHASASVSRTTRIYRAAADEVVDAMTGQQFEDYVAQAARSCGLPVIMTNATGDWGVDLIVGNRPVRLAIQCKRQNRAVGPTAVQEVVAGAPMQGCAKTMVVSNQEFTAAARKLAALHDCTLVGGSHLPALAAHIGRAVAERY